MNPYVRMAQQQDGSSNRCIGDYTMITLLRVSAMQHLLQLLTVFTKKLLLDNQEIHMYCTYMYIVYFTCVTM